MNLKRSLALAISVLMILTMPFAFGAGETLDRIAGSNKWETAVKICQEGWDKAGTVVLASGEKFADALAGVTLAYANEAPVLLTSSNSLVKPAKDEIVRLGANKVIILGGTAAISQEVEDELKGMGLEVVRVKGSGRAETAAEIAKLVAPNGADTVVLAYAWDFPDALAAASYAAIKGYPILLTEKNSLPEATEKAIESLGASNVIMVGGTGVITDTVKKALEDAKLKVVRVSGANREATSIALANYFKLPTTMYYIATGDNFADAIAGAALAAKNGTGILLVRKTLNETVANFLSENVSQAVIFGGTGAVSGSVATAIKGKLLVGNGGIAGTTAPGATVTVAGKTATADKYGNYQILGVAPGNYTVTFAKTGLATGTEKVNIVKDRVSVLDKTIGAKSESNIKIIGAVVNAANGAPLGGAEVYVQTWNADDSKWNKAVFVKAIDATSTFEITQTHLANAEFGDKVKVSIVKDPANKTLQGAFHPYVKEFNLKTDQEINDLGLISMNAVAKMTITGKVTDKDGKAVGLYTGNLPAEEFFEKGVSPDTISYAYDGHWYFKLSNPVVTGSAKLWIYLNGEWQTSQDDWDTRWEVFENSSHEWFARLAVGDSLLNYKIMVTYDYSVTNVSHHAVTLIYNDNPFVARSATTNAKGEYTFKDITMPSGEYTVIVNVPGNAVYAEDINIVEGQNQTLNIALKPGYNASLELRSQTAGKDLQGSAKAWIIQGNTVLDEVVGTLSSGQFSFAATRLAPGSYTVKVFGDFIKTQDFPLNIVDKNVNLAKQTLAAGRIVVTVTGAKLKDTTVGLIDKDDNVVSEKLTDANGQVIFGGLTPGEVYRVSASRKGFKTQTLPAATADPIKVVVNDTKEQTITALATVDVTGKAEGYVRNYNGVPAVNATITYYVDSVKAIAGKLQFGEDKYKVGEEIEEGTEYTNLTVTGTDGKYTVTDLAPGTYTVVVRHADHEYLVSSLTISAGDYLKAVNYNLEYGGNAKFVLTLTGKANVTTHSGIYLIDAFGETIYGPVVTTDNKYEFANLPAGVYYVYRDEDADYAELVKAVSVGKGATVKQTVELTTIAATNAVKLWVVNAAGTSLEDVEIVIGTSTFKTNSTGVATMSLPAGTYTATVYKHGYLVETITFTVGTSGMILDQLVLTSWK